MSTEVRPAHSPVGGSAVERFANCHGSVKLIQMLNLPESDEPDFRSWGTSAHEAAYVVLRDNLEVFEVIGQTFGKHTVDVEMATCLQPYVDECNSLRAEGETFLEFGVDYPEFHPGFYGTLDFGNVRERLLRIRDFKTGAGIAVDVENNPQQMYYAFGLLRHFPDIEEVELGIVQPRCFHPGGSIRTWRVGAASIKAWAYDVLRPAMNATEFDHDLDAGPWCRFCPAKLLCPVQRGLFGAAMQTDPKVIKELSTETLGRDYKYIAAVKGYIKALEAEVLRRDMIGDTVPGTKLVNKKADRIWKDGAAAALEVDLGSIILTEPEVRSPAQIEKLGLKAKELVKEWAYTPMTGYTIADLTDKRAAIIPEKAGDTFKDYLAKLTSGQE